MRETLGSPASNNGLHARQYTGLLLNPLPGRALSLSFAFLSRAGNRHAESSACHSQPARATLLDLRATTKFGIWYVPNRRRHYERSAESAAKLICLLQPPRPADGCRTRKPHLNMAAPEINPESRTHRANAEARAIHDSAVTSPPSSTVLSGSVDALAASLSASSMPSQASSTFSSGACTYPTRAYVHCGWVSVCQRYFKRI